KSQALGIKQVALYQLWEHRHHLELDVPDLSEIGWVNRHPLPGKLKFDGKGTELHHLRYEDTDRHRVCVGRTGLPVRQDVARIADAPATRQKVGRKGLKIHGVGCVWPGASKGGPVLEESPKDPLLGQIAYDSRGTDLPLPVRGRPRGAGGED